MSVPDVWSEISVVNRTLLTEREGYYGERAGKEGPFRLTYCHLCS